MRIINLKFSKSIFSAHLIVGAFLCAIPAVFDGCSWLSMLLGALVLFFYFVVSLLRSKSFCFKDDEIEIKYVFFNYKVCFSIHEIERIVYHRRKGERDFNFIEVSLKNGEIRKFIFSFVDNESRDSFFYEIADCIPLQVL